MVITLPSPYCARHTCCQMGEPMNDSRRVENDSTKPAAMAILKVGLLGQMQ
jgi:hypothetical protein